MGGRHTYRQSRSSGGLLTLRGTAAPGQLREEAAVRRDLLFAVSMIAVMPARFEVERAVVALGRPASADEIDERSAEQARRWLGPAVEPVDSRAWMRAHHFTADARFAHITYTIGYLLALGLHRRQTSYAQVLSTRSRRHQLRRRQIERAHPERPGRRRPRGRGSATRRRERHARGAQRPRSGGQTRASAHDRSRPSPPRR